jgi:iron(III) transport system substrate-binding protein
MSRGFRAALTLAIVLVLSLVGACGSPQGEAPTSTSITLYTCVNDTTAQPVIADFQATHPDIKVELFRAPTGQLNARVASDVRSGGLKADVIWACDPLTMQDYVDQDLVGGWTPQTDIPAAVRNEDYVGVALLYMVAITRKDVRAVATWPDLAKSGKVAVPDPKVAASALAALAYFGTDFYADLKDAGGVQVSTPDDVTTGVAQGIYDAGMTIASSAYAAEKSGSPVSVDWPKPGAVAIYGPIALAKSSRNGDAAREFISYVTSQEGQTTIGRAGSYPTLDGIEGPTKPENAPVVQPDWAALGQQKAALLEDYAKIFGG